MKVKELSDRKNSRVLRETRVLVNIAKKCIGKIYYPLGSRRRRQILIFALLGWSKNPVLLDKHTIARLVLFGIFWIGIKSGNDLSLVRHLLCNSPFNHLIPVNRPYTLLLLYFLPTSKFPHYLQHDKMREREREAKRIIFFIKIVITCNICFKQTIYMKIAIFIFTYAY